MGVLQDRREEKGKQITQRLNYQTEFVPRRVAQQRSISMLKDRSHERGLMKSFPQPA